MGVLRHSYFFAHFHDAFFAFKALFRQGITGKDYYPGLAVPVRFLAALCALNTGSGSPVSGSGISALFHSFLYVAVSSFFCAVNGKIVKLLEASREGHKFKGWFTGAEGGDEVTEETVFTADTTIYAYWEPNEEVPPEKYYIITLDANGGNCETGEIETDADGKIEQLPTASREGYVFEGWFTEAQDGEKITEKTVFVADTTVYAHWSVQRSKGDGIKKDGNVSKTNKKTNNTAPRTGDNNDLIIWFIMVIVSSIILLSYGLFWFKGKKLIL